MAVAAPAVTAKDSINIDNKDDEDDKLDDKQLEYTNALIASSHVS